MILFELKYESRWVFIYSSIILSSAGRLFIGLNESILLQSLSGLSWGVILDIFKMSGYIAVLMIEFIKWVICGAMRLIIFLYVLMDALSWPSEFEDLSFLIIFLVSLIEIYGKLNLLAGLGINLLRISIGEILCGINNDLILFILLI